jgi:hypothetical protein
LELERQEQSKPKISRRNNKDQSRNKCWLKNNFKKSTKSWFFGKKQNRQALSSSRKRLNKIRDKNITDLSETQKIIRVL